MGELLFDDLGFSEIMRPEVLCSLRRSYPHEPVIVGALDFELKTGFFVHRVSIAYRRIG